MSAREADAFSSPISYRKRIVVMETDWPVRCTNTANIPSSLLSIPFSAAGQVQWMKQIATVVNAIPNGLGVGIMYWEPGWIDNAVRMLPWYGFDFVF